MKAKSGFTLVEILIVVVILGILAAIVIPQFTEASTEARESSLKTDLQTLRSMIELYSVQHLDVNPTLLNFANQMTQQSDINGTVPPAAGMTALGPYLQQIPTNPFNTLNTLENSGTAGDGGAGWEYDENTGEIHADDTLSTPDGTAHSAL
jgi:general secretion pathway protein G